METQTRLNRHNEFISAENIIAIYIYMFILLFSRPSDFFHITGYNVYICICVCVCVYIYIYIYIYIHTQTCIYIYIYNFV